MDDSSLPSYPPSHLLIAPLGVDCKFAVVTIKKKKHVSECSASRSDRFTFKKEPLEPLDRSCDGH